MNLTNTGMSFTYTATFWLCDVFNLVSGQPPCIFPAAVKLFGEKCIFCCHCVTVYCSNFG